MSLLMCDSFDYYATAQILRKYASATNAAIDASFGRRGKGCLKLGTFGASISSAFSPLSTFIFGVAVYIQAFSASISAYLIGLRDGSSLRLQIRIASGGQLIVERYNGGSPAAIANVAAGLSLNAWHYLEFRFVIHDTTGELEIRVNGVSVSNQTGIDTKDSLSATLNVIEFLNQGSNVYSYFDDFYFCDESGSTCNDFLGDVRIDAYLPAANGNSSGFVGSDADSTDNYLLVDETSPDDDTTYVESNTAGVKDTYAFTEMTHNPAEIIATQLCAMGKKTDAGSRTIHLVTRSGGTDYDTAAAQSFGTSYGIKTKIDEVDPNTSAAWTKTNLNNAEFGIKVAS